MSNQQSRSVRIDHKTTRISHNARVRNENRKYSIMSLDFFFQRLKSITKRIIII